MAKTNVGRTWLLGSWLWLWWHCSFLCLQTVVRKLVLPQTKSSNSPHCTPLITSACSTLADSHLCTWSLFPPRWQAGWEDVHFSSKQTVPNTFCALRRVCWSDLPSPRGISDYSLPLLPAELRHSSQTCLGRRMTYNLRQSPRKMKFLL